MLFKLIDHQRKPCMTSKTFDRGIWVAILISETSSVVSSVMASCNIKQVSFFLSFYFFLFRVKVIGQIYLFCFKMDVLFFFCIQIAC